MPIELRQQRQALPRSPTMQVLALVAVSTVPLKPKMARLLRFPHKLIIPSGAAVDSAPRRIIGSPRHGVVAGEAVVVALSRRRRRRRRRRSVGRWRGMQFPVEVRARETVALARPPMVADLLAPCVRRWRPSAATAAQTVEYALVSASIDIHHRVNCDPVGLTTTDRI